MFSKPDEETVKKSPRCLVHLWEFLLEMLMDDSFTSIIEWTDETNGEFKIKNCEVVAKKWGKRKQKYDMNYDKLSRSLRYYYKKDIIQKVSGRRFVYKFIQNSEMRRAVDTIKTSMMRQGRKKVPVGPFPSHQVLTDKTTTYKQNSSNTDTDNFYESSPSSQQSSVSYKSSSPSPPLNEPEVFFNTDKKQNFFETPKNLLFSNNYIKNYYRDEKSNFYNHGIASDIEHTLHAPSSVNEKQFLDYCSTSANNESLPNKTFWPVNYSDNHILNKKDVLSEQFRFQDQIINDYNEMRQKSEVDTIKTSMMRQGQKNISVGPFPNHQILTEKTNAFKQKCSNTIDDNFYQFSPSSEQSFKLYKSTSPSPPPNEPEEFFNTNKKQNIFKTPNSLLFSNNYIKNYYLEEKSNFFNPGTALDREHALHAPSYDDGKQLLDYSNTSTNNESFHNKTFRPVNYSDNHTLNKKDVSEQFRFQDQIINDYNEMRQKNALTSKIYNDTNFMEDFMDNNSFFSLDQSVKSSQQFQFNRQKNLFFEKYDTKKPIETGTEFKFNTLSKIYVPQSVSSSIVKPSALKLSEVLESLNDAQLELDQNKKYRSTEITKSDEHFITYPVINRLLQSTNVNALLSPSPCVSPELSAYQLPPGYVLRKYVPLIDASTQTTHLSE